MDKDILQKVEQLNKQRRATKRWQRIVAGLAAVVLIATNGVLSLPAETTENQTYCGIEEHAHIDECYEVSAELVCELDESEGHTHAIGCYSAMLCGQEESEGHQHTDACSGEATLGCGQEESEGHAHDEICNGEAVLSCGQDGVEGHSHDDSCYTTPVICGKDVSEGHAHADTCYTTQVVCGLEASEGHTHTLDCCDTTTLSCTLDEGESHSHTDTCYGEETSTLACQQEVHTHELLCFSDPSADVETAASWEAAFTNLSLSGNWGQDLVTIAKTQLGYTESASNYEVEDDGVTTRGYTRYGVWLGDPYMDWSAAFVAFCLHYAEVEGVPAYTSGTVSQWRQVLQAANMTRDGDAQVGDLVFLDDDADGTTDHVGIVSAAEGTLTIILGDDQNSVRQRTNPNVLAVVALPENPNAPTEETTAPTDATTVPEDETTAPEDETTTPEDETTTPEDETTAPEDETTTPEDETTAPEDETTAPEDETTTPEDETTAPEDETTTPEDETTAPEDETTTPEDETTAPTEDYSISLMSDLITGTCGDGVTYELDLDSGILTISGSGAMDNYSASSPAPWNSYAADISTVVINDGVTTIGSNAFYECTNLTTATIPASVTTIGGSAFYKCANLTNITIPDTVTSIGYSAFYDCNNISVKRSGTYGDNITYTLDTGSGELILSGTGNMPSAYSPGTPWNAFATCFTTVTIDSGITSIGDFALYDCKNLTAIEIPNSVTSIGNNAFTSCTSLTSITLPGSVISISGLSFQNCTGLTSITIPEGVKSINNGTFRNCSNLTSVTIPEGVVNIDSNAFEGCTSLTEIELPSSVTSISSTAFSGCTNLKTVSGTCGENVTFSLNLGNRELVISGTGAMTIYNYNSAPWCTFATNIATVKINPGVTSIGGYAFSSCTNLTEIEIPNSVTSIDGAVFWNCSSLKSIDIPDGVTSIAGYTFYGCTGLTSVTIPDSVTSIAYFAFQNCSSLTSIDIPDGVTSIAKNTFSSCSSLTSVSIPDGVTSIGDYAFQNCTDLTSIEIPASVTSISGTAFSGCTNLTSLTLPAGVSVDINTLKTNCPNLTSVTISGNCGAVGNEANVTYTLDLISGELVISGEGAMADYQNYGTKAPWNQYANIISSVVINEGVSSIGNYAFYYCTSLADVTLPSALTSIGNCSFYNCTNLNQTVKIPATVTNIGGSAFYNSPAVLSGTFSGTCGDGVTFEMDLDSRVLTISGSGSMKDYSVNNGYPDAPWSGCSSYIDSIVFAQDSAVTHIGNYAFYSCANLTAVAIPESVESIGTCAFYNCTNLTVSIPETVTSIGSSAFYGCTLTGGKLTGECGVEGANVTFELDFATKTLTFFGDGAMADYSYSYYYPKYTPWHDYRDKITTVVFDSESNISRIGNSAFSGCTKLETISIPSSVTTIGDNAFQNCDSLQSITIPDSVTSISAGTFYFCDNLTNVSLSKNLTSIGANTFRECVNLASIDIPEGVTAIGNDAFSGCSSLTSIDIPDGVTSIGTYAFSGCSGLTSIDIPEKITTIGNQTFYNCTGLTFVSIPESVTTINGYAFWNCTALTSIDLPGSVTSLDKTAFSGCTALSSITLPASTSLNVNTLKSTYPNLTSLLVYGDCGEDVTFVLNLMNGEMVISGEGEMENYTADSERPWKKYASYIESLTVNSGVTHIGSYSFYTCASLHSISLAESVTSIGDYAFYGCYGLLASIPETVTSIGEKAFYGCLTVKDGIISGSCGTNATFALDTVNGDLVISGSGDMMNYANAISAPWYDYAANIDSVVINEGITSIGDNNFSNFTNLTNIEIPEGVTKIGTRAFEGCTGLTNIEIPSSVTDIYSYAFSDCTGLTSIEIPSGVTYISDTVLSGCTGLTSLTLSSSKPHDISKLIADCPNVAKVYGSCGTGVTFELDLSDYSLIISGEGAMADYDYDYSSRAPWRGYATNISSVVINDGVTAIGDYAFYNHKNITSITLPDSVTSIGSCAFGYCTGLSSINIPESLTTLNKYAFSDCPNIKVCGPAAISIFDPETGVLTILGHGDMTDYTSIYSVPWYSYGSSITGVAFAPESKITHIGDLAFQSLSNLKEVNISESVTSIGANAFSRCTGLESLKIPAGVATIGNYAFYYCTNLESIEFSEGVTTIGNCAFYNCTNLESIEFPEGLASIGNYAFYNCTNLESIEFPETIASTGNNAFYGCTPTSGTLTGPCGENLTYELDFATGAVTISGTGTMTDYSTAFPPPWNGFDLDITSVTFAPDSEVTHIGAYSFEGAKLTSLEIPASVTSIGEKAFYNCTSLTTSIPDTVTSVGYQAFYGCTLTSGKLTGVCGENATFELDIESGVLTISGYGDMTNYTVYNAYNPNSSPAPWYGINVKEVQFAPGSNITSVGSAAFADCDDLTSIVLPNSVKTMGNSVFYSCSNLTSVVLPKDITAIGSSTFYYCSNLTNVTIPASVTSIGDSAFSCSGLTSIVLPDGVTTIGNYIFYNCDDLTSAVLSDSLASISNNAFSGCDSLTSVVLPERLTSIGEMAFYSCSLSNVELPEGLTAIGAEAFRSSGLRDVVLPGSLTSIGNKAFNCNLTSITIPAGINTLPNDILSRGSLREVTLYSVEFVSDESDVWRYVNTLIVGETVDTLSGTFANSMNLSTLEFRGPNYFTLDADLSRPNLNKCLATLTAGDYYVDESGVLYALDSETMTATLIYCPAGVEEYTIPAAIPTEDGTGVYTLTTIQECSFLYAEDLTSVTFPDAAITVESLAFTGSGLMTANGVNTLSELKKLVPSVIFETGAFYQTGIVDGETETTESITATANGLNVSVITTPSEDGSFNFYTGQEATTTIEIENTVQNNVLRVYVAFDANDPYGSIDKVEGEYTYENHPYEVFKPTNLPNTYCLEFPLVPGDTFSYFFKSIYADGVSDGGSALIYAVALTPDEAAELGHTGHFPGTYNRLTWGIHQEDFSLSWLNAANYTKTLSFLRDETTDPARLHISENMDFKFLFQPAAETLDDGNDNVEYVDFKTVLTLPEGLTWRPDFAEAIQRGNISVYNNGSPNNVYVDAVDADYVRFFHLNRSSPASAVYSSSVSIDIVTAEDGTEQILINWRYTNPTPEEAEILSTTFSPTFYRAYTIQVKEGYEVDYNEVFEVTMDVTADVHYYHSDEVPQLTAKGVRKISADDFKISTSVVLPKVDQLHAGEAYPTTLQIINNSAATTYLQELSPTYQLPDYYYMSSEDLAAAFQADYSDNLMITIAGANLCTNGTTAVTGTDGNPHVVSSPLMGENVPYLDPKYHTAGPCESHRTVDITLQKDANGNITITNTSSGASETVSADAASIQRILDSWGFTVGYQTVYTLNWNLGHLKLAGKQTIKLSMPTHAKDTFMRLSQDLQWFAADDGNGVLSEFKFNDANNGLLTLLTYRSDSVGNYVDSSGNETNRDGAQKYEVTGTNRNKAFAPVWRDFTLFQGASKLTDDGYVLAEKVTDGDILRFDINVLHWGDATYEALPLVAHLVGPQFPLVPVVENTALANTGLVSEEVDTEIYYVLKEGTYKNVYIGGAWADTVIVSGQDTMIYWYLTENAENKESMVNGDITTFSFLTSVDPTEEDATNGFTIGIYEWLNNHQTHRLWDRGLLPGNIPTPEKEVVVDFKNEADPEDDEVTELYRVKQGEAITYRLTLSCDADSDVVVKGDTLWDVLPLTVEDAAWSKDNISVRYAGPGSIRMTEDDEWTNATEWVSGSEWEITDWVDTDDTEETQVHQRLEWNDNFQLKFKGQTYIYMTLQFPEDTEGGPNLWTQLVERHGTTRLENIFHQYSFEDAAYLNLSIETEASIQKGVVESGVNRINSLYYVIWAYNKGDDLFYYTNPATKDRYVTYYASIYNDGPGRMYIESIQDVLPKGFSIVDMADVSRLSALAPTVSGADQSVRSYNITNVVTYATTSNVNTNGETRITFELEGDYATMTSLGFVYDETLQRYYLLPGTHVYFGYNCKVGDINETQDTAINRLAVSFYDYAEGGITVDEEVEIGRTRYIGTDYNDGPLKDPNEENAPDCWVATDQELSGYGFDYSGESDDVWLTTNVTVKREKIAPGIKKEAAMLTSLNNKTDTEFNSASGTDVITWRITSVNDSRMPINGYTLTDVLPQPYTFADNAEYSDVLTGIGDVYYTVYDSKTATSGTEYKLFTILSRSTADDGTVTLTIDQPAAWLNVTVDVGGEPVKVLVSNTTSLRMYVMVSFNKDDAGNEDMSIHFPANHTDENGTYYRCPAIPGYGRSELRVNTFNTTGVYENTRYLNQCYITPEQDFDTSKTPSVGRIVPYTVDGTQYDSVYNSAPITVSSGHTTSSYKQVAEVGNDANTAVGTDDANASTIRINSETAKFRYTLTVEGPESKPMDQLVFIDNLPEPEDINIIDGTSRGSGFQVDLADDPNFVVTVIPEGEEPIELSSSDYTVSYSTESGPFGDEDWAGTTDWNATIAEARSIRVVIRNEDGSVMPAGSTVTVSFTAKVHVDSQTAISELYGQTAWNGFGYRYWIGNSALQSAPLNVGVQFRSAPTLRKELQDYNGNPYVISEPETFRFLIYTGDALENLSNTTEAKMAAALALAQRSYSIVDVTVQAGSSYADLSLTALKQYSYSNDWVATETDWEWILGDNYTVMELPIDADSLYYFKSIGGSGNNCYTLAYDGSSSQIISAVNTRKTWTLELTKENTQGQALKDAWFGLYSPSTSGAMTKEQAKRDGLAQTPELEWTDKDGNIYHLIAISSSNASGKIYWSNLTQDKYLVRELQAPDGYILCNEAHVVKWEGEEPYPAKVEITVYNDNGYALPDTGRNGVEMFYLLGAAFVLGAATLLVNKKRKYVNP